MRKYEFTENEKEYQQTTFRQIRALRDIRLHGVQSGDLGGWIEEEINLSHEGACWVGEESFVMRNASVTGDAGVRGKSIVDFRSRISDRAVVSNSVVHGINSIGDRSVVTDSDIRGQCVIKGDSRIESSKVEGLMIKGDALIHNSQCFTRLGQLIVEPGCKLRDTELRLMDNEPYLARNTQLINVEALDVALFRIYDPNVTLKYERFANGKRVKIGSDSKVSIS